MHQHRSEPELAHAAAANEVTAGHPEDSSRATDGVAPRETNAIMDALVRDYLKSAPRSTEPAA